MSKRKRLLHMYFREFRFHLYRLGTDDATERELLRRQPEVQLLVQECGVMEMRLTVALLAETIRDFVELKAHPLLRRNGRRLLRVWMDCLQNRVGGLVLDYREQRTLKEMQCVSYLYLPLSLRLQGLQRPEWDGCVPDPSDTNAVADECGCDCDSPDMPDFRPFRGPSDTWQWN